MTTLDGDHRIGDSLRGPGQPTDSTRHQPPSGQQQQQSGIWTLVQPFIFARGDRNSCLYARTRPRSAPAHQRSSGATTSMLSFDCYINSFYEAYWATYTSIGVLSLVAAGHGACWCVVRRTFADGSSETIDCVNVELQDTLAVLVTVELGRPSARGRISVEFGRVAQPFTLFAAGWATSDAPQRPVSVGVALTTFNREPLLLETLTRIFGAPEAARIAKVVVINHGAPLNAQRVGTISDQAKGRALFVEQANFGGAGGFTRGAMELLKDSTITHVLFMDDDIELEPGHIITAAAFAAFANNELVVGGQMLDLFKPLLMFEAGTCVTPANLLEANHRNLMLNRYDSLQALADVKPSDFNAWWFSLIPAAAFRRVGLPAPLFIRGDDQEFGVRMGLSGIQTVSLPPVSVWHEPFYARPPGWQLYYDLRNRLIFASLYSDRYRLDGPVQLMKRLLSMLLRYDYQQAVSICLALTDYSRGPKLIAEEAPDIHSRVLRALAKHIPAVASGCSGNAQLADEEHPLGRSGGRLRLAVSFLRVAAGFPKPNRAGPNCKMIAAMPLDLMHLGTSYTLTDEGDHFAQHFRYSILSTWRHLVITSWAIMRYARTRHVVARQWKDAMPGLTTFSSWSMRLGMLNNGPE